MEFRPLLQILEIGFGYQLFTAKDVLGAIYNPVLIGSKKEIGRYLQSILPISPKMVSKDLNRLFRMSFLDRTKAKRQVKTKTGKVCNKGVAYIYSLNGQGHSYVVNYLWNPAPKPRKEILDDADLLLKEYNLRQSSSQEEAEARWALFSTMCTPRNLRPIDKRFPIRRDPFTAELLLRMTKERDLLRKELPEIKKQIDDLKKRP